MAQGFTSDDVVIRIGASIQPLLQSVKNARKILNSLSPGTSQFDGVATSLSRMELATKNVRKQLGGKGFLPPSFADSFTDVNKEVKELGSGITQKIDPQLSRAVSGATTKMKKELKDMEEKSRGFLKRQSIAFQGWALSIMFFGMALQRLFTSIWKSSTKTFQDVMHSVNGTVTGFDLLNGSIAYLSFAIGSALEPIAAFLAPIIDAVAEWVTENENLVAGIVAVGAIVGTTLAVGGVAFLAAAGFLDVFQKLGVAVVDVDGKITGWNWGAFGRFLTNPTVLLVAAALAVIAGLSWKAFKETPEAWAAAKDAITPMADAFKKLRDDVDVLVSGLFPDFTGLWDILAWTIAWVLNIISSFGALFIGVISVVINALGTLVTGMKDVASAAVMMWDAIWSGKVSNISFKTLEAQFDATKAAYQRTVESLKDLDVLRTNIGDVLFTGPTGLKAEYEKKKKDEAWVEQRNVYIDRIEMWNNEGLDNAQLVNRLFQTVLQDMKARA